MDAQSSKVDAFVSQAKDWHGEIQTLRSSLLDCGLDEELKRGKPCFMFEGIALCHGASGANWSSRCIRSPATAADGD